MQTACVCVYETFSMRTSFILLHLSIQPVECMHEICLFQVNGQEFTLIWISKLEMLFLLGFHVVDCIIAEQVPIYFDNDVVINVIGWG